MKIQTHPPRGRCLFDPPPPPGHFLPVFFCLPFQVEGGRENVIFDIATGAQQLADAQLPDDEFDKYKRKEPVKEEEGEEGGDEATAEKRGASMDGGDEDDLGM